jgi:C4-type Zn-finger protein
METSSTLTTWAKALEFFTKTHASTFTKMKCTSCNHEVQITELNVSIEMSQKIIKGELKCEACGSMNTTLISSTATSAVIPITEEDLHE